MLSENALGNQPAVAVKRRQTEQSKGIMALVAYPLEVVASFVSFACGAFSAPFGAPGKPTQNPP